MGIIEKFLRLLTGKANKALEDAENPLEQLLLIKEKFYHQVGEVKEARTKVKGELNLAKKELDEMNIEMTDTDSTLGKLKAFAQAGNELTEDDKVRGQKLVSKRDRLVTRIANQQSEINRIAKVDSELASKATELDIKMEEIADKIEDAQRTDTTSKATDSYAQALEIINDETSSKSMEAQLHKLDKQASQSEARADIAKQGTDSFDFDKKSSSLDDFLKS